MRFVVRIFQWLGFVLLCNGVGFASAMVANEPAYYQLLAKPSWAPPGSVFGPVWTALYTLLGSATWIVWTRTRDRERRRAMTAFAIQLALNATWTPIFFGLHQLGLAVVVIVAVLCSVLIMGAIYWRVQRWAGLAIVPLAAWVAFATCLNVAIW